MRVLIVAHDFPPLNSVGARRPFSWYLHFSTYGIHPVVITKAWGASSASVTEIFKQNDIEGIKADYQQDRTLIQVRMQKTLSERLLANYGDQQFVFLRKAFTFLNLVLSYPLSFFDKNILIYREAKRYLKEHDVDYILATGEPFILFKYGYLLSRKFGVPWIADFRDGWYLNHVTAQKKGLAIACLRKWEYLYEKKYLATCRFIVTVDPLLAAKLESLHKKKTHVVYNGFEDFFPDSQIEPTPGLPLILSHSGTVYPGHQVEILLTAILEMHQEGKISPGDVQLKFWGLDYFPEQRLRVRNFSKELLQYITTSPRLPREEVILKNAASDFLIAFTERNQPVIPAKTYEYFAVRRPIVVILNDHSILSSLIADLNAGISINSKEDLKSFLLEKINLKKNNLPVFTDILKDGKVVFYSRKHQTLQLALLFQQNALNSSYHNDHARIILLPIFIYPIQ